MATILTTPFGESRWSYINKPQPENKFGKTNYSNSILLSSEQVDALNAAVNKVLDTEYTKAKKEKPTLKKIPFEFTVREFKDKDKKVVGTGLTFQKNALNKDGSPVKSPVVVDAAGKPIPTPPVIGTGSIISIAFAVKPYTLANKFEVTTVLAGVQIKELKEYAGSSGIKDEDVVFEATEGYVFSSQPAQENLDGDESF